MRRDAVLSTWLERDDRLSTRTTRLIRTRTGRLVAAVIAHTGDSVAWLLLGGLLVAAGQGTGQAMGLRIVVTAMLTGLVSGVLKLLFRRPRPGGPRAHFYLRHDRHGFPSGHAARVWGLCVTLAPLLPWWGGLLLAAWAAAVSTSRIALGLHFVSDVGAGFLVGCALGIVLLIST